MTIFIGDALEWLRKLPSESVNCIVTSPPYFGLRDYGITGQAGLEPTPELFIENMTTIFTEARRVLRHDGTLWLNIADSYASAKGRHSSVAQTLSGKSRGEPVDNNRPDLKEYGYKDKDMLFIPHRLAMSLQSSGWWVRNDIVWHKPNPMPESVTDRCTKSHEYVFLCAKSERYYFDADAIRENANSGTDMGILRSGNAGTDDKVAWHAQSIKQRQEAGIDSRIAGNGTRNKRDVWTINTEASGVAHFATMPLELAETCIKAGCPETVCAECGAPYVAIVEASGETIGKGWTNHKADLSKGMSQVGGSLGTKRDADGKFYTRTLKGYEPTCTCNGATRPGVVLDPFGGAGTTALAAVKHNRHYQLIELNIKYVGIAQQRIAAFNPFQDKPLADGSKQLSLFSGLEI